MGNMSYSDKYRTNYAQLNAVSADYFFYVLS